MSDYFGELSLCGDCIEDESFHYATTSCEYEVNGVDAGEAICYAVNNHDKLVEALLAITSDYVQLANSGDAGCWSADDVEAIVNSRKLLKELGHEI